MLKKIVDGYMQMVSGSNFLAFYFILCSFQLFDYVSPQDIAKSIGFPKNSIQNRQVTSFGNYV